MKTTIPTICLTDAKFTLASRDIEDVLAKSEMYSFIMLYLIECMEEGIQPKVEIREHCVFFGEESTQN